MHWRFAGGIVNGGGDVVGGWYASRNIWCSENPSG
jgi:hypothetical protein